MVSLEGGGGGGGGYVNPYHQAWTAQAEGTSQLHGKPFVKKARVDKRKLWEVVEGQEEPVVGLENVVEWWPAEDSEAAPLYTCQICHGWVGWGGEAARHLGGDQHRRRQLLSRYPALEEMIKDMQSAALLERAREEERKHGRRGEVIQVVTDSESYEEFYLKLENKPFRVSKQFSSHPPAAAAANHPHHPHHPQPPLFQRPPPPGGGFLMPRFSRPPPSPLAGPPPMAALPPVNVPPPMNFPPPPPSLFPDPFRPGPVQQNKQYFGPGRGRGDLRPRGRGHLPLPRGGGGGGEGYRDRDRGGQPNHRGNYSARENVSSQSWEPHRPPYPAPREQFESRRDFNETNSDYFSRQKDEYYDHRPPSGKQQGNFVREEVYEERNDSYYYQDNKYQPNSSRSSPERRPERGYARGRQPHRPSERSLRVAPAERRSQQRTSHSRRRPDRDRGPGPRRRKEVAYDDLDEEDLPEACYAVSADQEELDTENNTDGGKRKRSSRDNHRSRPYDDYYGQYHEKSRRSITRFYESKQEKRKRPLLAAVEDKPYEGPTIFDKVFRTKRKGDDDGGPGGERSEKQIDKEMEAEWRRYKEESEERIRREKEKVEKYEEKLRQLHGSEQSKRRRTQSQPQNSPETKSTPRAKSPPKAYGGRATYSSSESDRETSPVSPVSEKCQTKFDPY